MRGTGKLFLFLLLLTLCCISGVAAELKSPKYIFLMIGDGMGTAQVSLAAEYSGRADLFGEFPVAGLTRTRSLNSFITDSAAAGTALATGSRTDSGMIGQLPDGTLLESCSEAAKRSGRKVGIVTSVSLDHATPAAFYARSSSRSNYYEIALQMAGSDFDYFAGGGILFPRGRDGERPDVWDLAAKNGFRLVSSMPDFKALQPGAGKVIAISPQPNGDGSLSYAIDGGNGVPTLAEYTAKGIELLDSPGGFFMMVEGGMIDWAGHANDAATMLGETLAFREAVETVLRFAESHPEETLIIVTADHETGGLSLGHGKLPYGSRYGLLKSQKMSFRRFAELRKGVSTDDELKRLITAAYGLKFQGGADDPLLLTQEEQRKLEEAFRAPPAGYDSVAVTASGILAAKAGLNWGTGAHSGAPVTTRAHGVNAEFFRGSYDNTRIGELLKMMMHSESQTGKSADLKLL